MALNLTFQQSKQFKITLPVQEATQFLCHDFITEYFNITFSLSFICSYVGWSRSSWNSGTVRSKNVIYKTKSSHHWCTAFCIFTLHLVFPALLNHVWKSSSDMTVRPALMPFNFFDRQKQMMFQPILSLRKRTRSHGEYCGWEMVRIWFIKNCCMRRKVWHYALSWFLHFPANSTKWHQSNASYCPTGKNLCCVPQPSCWKKQSTQILWPTNYS